jgi:hypothetical protein
MPQPQRKASNFHLVFDNSIGFNLCVTIQHLLVSLGILQYEHIALRKNMGDMTLRVSETVESTGIKPAPEPLKVIKNIYCTRHDGNIRRYLDFVGFSRLFLEQSKKHRHGLDKARDKK